MATFSKISCNSIKEGMRFSAPVFFDDGKNMFLAEKKAVKPYHIAALINWHIPFLLSYGRPLSDEECARYAAIEAGGAPYSALQQDDDIGELEELGELEPVD